MSSQLNFAADCWVLKWGETKIGFCAVLPQPTGTANYCKRISRLVILPDFQGLGVGTKFLDAICDIYVKRGFKMYIRSSHIKLANHWSKSELWRPTARNGKKSDNSSHGTIHNSKYNDYLVNRECYSYEYMGKEFAAKNHMEIVVDSIKNIDMNEMRSYLSGMMKSNYLTIIHNGVKHESALNVLCKELGIRTELLYINGVMSKKRIGCDKLVSLKKNHKPVFKKVA